MLTNFILYQASMNRWMPIPNIRYVIASRYNVIFICLSTKQYLTIFPFRSQPPVDTSVHYLIYVGHINDNHFVQV